MTDICDHLRFELRDWKPEDRFHFPSVNALAINKAIATIDALRAELAEANVVLRSIALLDYDHAQDGTANFEHLQSLAYRYLERTESHG